MNKKSRKGLWLSLAVLAFAVALILPAYDHISRAAASVPAASPATLDLTVDNSCLDCHMPPLPDMNSYCHIVLPSESYNSRLYLGEHLDWMAPNLTIPTNLYLPLKTTLPANESRVHLFERSLFPATLTVNVGTTVTWTNLDIRDYTLASQPTLQAVPFASVTPSVTLKPGESISYTFATAGTFTYTYQYTDDKPAPTAIYQSGYGKVIVTAPKP